MNIASISQMVQQPVKASSKGSVKPDDFGSVMSSILSGSQIPANGNVESVNQKVVTEIKQILQTQDLGELFQASGVKPDDILKEVAFLEKLPPIEKLADELGIDLPGIVEMLNSILNDEPQPILDGTPKLDPTFDVTDEVNMNSSVSLSLEGKSVEKLWNVIQTLVEKQPIFQAELLRSLKADGVPANQTKDLIKLLKTMELILPNTDMTTKQETLTTGLKEILTKFESALAQTDTRRTLPEFRPLIKVIDIKTDSNNGVSLHVDRTVTKMESHSIVLPANRSNQGEAFVKEFQAIMNRSAFGQAGGVNKLLIKIYPENLGTVRIELVQKDGVLTARLLASTSLGKELLDSQTQQLRQAFAQQNLTVERLEVSQALQDPTRHDRNQSFGHQFKQQQQPQDEQQEQEQPKESFLDLLMEVEE